MSKQLNDPSNADATLDPPSEPSALELTPREIAIAEGRDPDEPEPVEEVAEEVVEDEPEQPAGEVADEHVADPPAEPTQWYGDSDRQFAEQYGISEWHLQQFGSREEFRKAAALLDAAESRRQSQAPAATKAPEPAAKAEPEYVDEPVVDGKVNVEWYRKHDYDEGTVKAMEAQRSWQDKLEAKFAEQETSAKQQQEAAEEAETNRQAMAFHEAADALRPDFYGKAFDEYGNVNKLTPTQYQRRQELHEEVYWLAQRMADKQQRAGLPVSIPSYPALIKQAEVRAFGDELNRQTKDQQVAAAKAQARTIRPAAGSVGAGTARRASAPKTTESVEDISQDPEVIEAWNRASPQNR